MKRIITVTSAILASTQAFAGNLVEPMMEPEVSKPPQAVPAGL
ncbi:hypothetical protein [Profundibacter sp.]